MSDRRIFYLNVHLDYNYGGDTGPGSLLRYAETLNYDELIKKIDALGKEVREAAKQWKPT